jgi:hypothetical protein
MVKDDSKDVPKTEMKDDSKDVPKTEVKTKKEPKEVMQEVMIEIPPDRPTMIGLNEFINSASLRSKYKVETLGGFLHWVIGKSPNKLPYNGWNALLEQFANRIV